MFEKAKWIWNSAADLSDSYVEFRTNCEFNENDVALLRISAHTNYAVYLNGVFVESGQYADFPHYKVYDEIDLSGHIQSGENRLAFVVWYEGVPTFTQAKSNPGLLFEIERNGEIVIFSGENILSRKSQRYISGRKNAITPQVGLSFHVDLRQDNNWMITDDIPNFGTSILAKDMPTVLYPREIKKLIVKPRLQTEMITQGTFSYDSGGNSFGEKMQHAALSFLELQQMENSENEFSVMKRKSQDGLYFMIDIGEETAGYLDFDLEVDEDCELEVGWGEHLEDGRCRTSIDGRNFSLSANLKQGRNIYMNPFRRLGCRYLQFFVHTNKVKINYAGLRPTIYPLHVKKYESENLLRDRIYAVCQNTLIQCMHEHYEDCPWREQAFYTLDSRNQMLCGYYAFDEYQFPRAGLRLISRSSREDGMLPICYPADSPACIPSFSLAYIIQLAEYYQYSADRETVEYCFDCADGIMDAFMNQMDETGLLVNFDEDKGFWNFYEWQPYLTGYLKLKNVHDMCLNAFFSLAIDSFVKLCDVVGIPTESYLMKKKQLNRRIVETFWDEQVGLFRASDHPESAKLTVLANAWGYLCGAAEGRNCKTLLSVISKNGGMCGDEEVISATLSMATFRYDALIQADRELYKDSILKEIDETYLYMLNKGATSFWETIQGDKDFEFAGSLCHGWSAMPIYYYETLAK